MGTPRVRAARGFGALFALGVATLLSFGCEGLIGADFNRSTDDGGASGVCDPNSVSADAHNCGRCGHDCLGGSCSAGACQPVVLASGRSRPADIAVANGYVYFADEGTAAANTTDGKVARVPIGGCEAESGGASSCVTELATNRQAPSGIAVNSEALYWTEVGAVSTTPSGTVMRLAFDNTPMTKFASIQDGPRKVAVDDPNIISATPSAYWINGNSGEVRRRFLEDGTANGSAIVTNVNAPVAIASNGTRICFSSVGDGDISGTVNCCDPTGAPMSTLGTALALPRGLSIGATHVYWANSGDGTIRRATPTGGDKSIVLTNRKTPSDVRVTGNAIFWVESGSAPNYDDGAVAMADLDGGNVVTLATGQRNPRRLSVDATAVYWIDSGSTLSDAFDGAVMKVALP
jgi:hypothetical protein